VIYAARGDNPRLAVRRAFVVGAAAAEFLTLWNTIRRYMVGLDGSLTFRHTSWRPPLNPWLLLAINAAAIAWLGTLALTPQADRTPSPSARRPTALRELTVTDQLVT